MPASNTIGKHPFSGYVSTGQLPSPELVQALVDEAHEKFKSNTEGQNSQVYAAGDADYEFTIMSVSKPFVLALVSEIWGPDEVREKIGVNATGRAFNSLEGIERGDGGRTNPMVNAGAIATTSLVPGKTLED